MTTFCELLEGNDIKPETSTLRKFDAPFGDRNDNLQRGLTSLNVYARTRFIERLITQRKARFTLTLAIYVVSIAKITEEDIK